MKRPAREAFRDSPHKEPFKLIAGSEPLQVACEYALLALLEELPDGSSPGSSWDSFSQICGARKVIDILLSLHKPASENSPIKPPKLNYKV